MNPRFTLTSILILVIFVCVSQRTWIIRDLHKLRQRPMVVVEAPNVTVSVPSTAPTTTLHFPPRFPSDLLDIMRISCLSILCAHIETHHNKPDFDEQLQLMAASDPTFVSINHKISKGWDKADVVDLSNAAVDGMGDVAVCTSDNQVSEVHGSYGCKDTVSSNQCISAAVELDKLIVISQMWGEGYFHYVVEDLPRFITALDYLAQHNESADQWYVHHAISPPASSSNLMGVKGMVSGYVRAKRVLLPRSSPCGGSMGSERIRRLRSLIHTRFELKGGGGDNLVVFKRSGRRSMQNHGSILAEAQRLWKAGSVAEHTGDGSFVEQMQQYAAVAVLIGPHGSGLTNMISMKAGSTVVEILPETGDNRLNMCYVALAYALGFKYHALRAPGYDSSGIGILPIASLTNLPIWPETPPLLCVITTFKPTDEALKKTAFNNTARMYRSLGTVVRAFLGIAEQGFSEQETWWLQAGHSPSSILRDIETNEHGTPSLSSLVQRVEQACPQRVSFVAYSNGDIMFDHSLVDTLKAIQSWAQDASTPPRLMMVGRRSNHNLKGMLDMADVKHADATLFQTNAQDYFIMTRTLISWAHFPNFVIGRRAYDNALVDWAYHHATLVDATDTVKALHQTTADGNFAGHNNQKDGEYNARLPNVVFDHGTTSQAQFKTVRDEWGAVALVNTIAAPIH